jgi:TatD DNase family protein
MNAALFDAHCHIQDERLAGDAAGVIRRAEAAGVTRMLCCGVAERDWRAVAELAAFPQILPAFGLHPWYVGERSPEWLPRLTALLQANPSAGVGEIGLDHALKARDDSAQIEVFLAQIELACKFDRVVSLHCRQAWGALMAHRSLLAALPRGFVVHSYSGSVETVPAIIGAGGYISFSGAVTWPRNVRGQAAAKAVPLERLLIETDAPDLMPFVGPEAAGEEVRAQRVNEPANLGHVLRKVAALRGLAPETLAEQLLLNSVRFAGR